MYSVCTIIFFEVVLVSVLQRSHYQDFPQRGHSPPLYSLFCDNNFVRIKIYNIIVLSVKAILIIIHENIHSDPLLPFIFFLGETLSLWSYCTSNWHKSYYNVWTTYVHIHYMKCTYLMSCTSYVFPSCTEMMFLMTPLMVS